MQGMGSYHVLGFRVYLGRGCRKCMVYGMEQKQLKFLGLEVLEAGVQGRQVLGFNVVLLCIFKKS